MSQIIFLVIGLIAGALAPYIMRRQQASWSTCSSASSGP
jgi:uncharacterized membrane protein YeaQ/YmgE (transglycosylase-associated protein family)